MLSTAPISLPVSAAASLQLWLPPGGELGCWARRRLACLSFQSIFQALH